MSSSVRLFVSIAILLSSVAFDFCSPTKAEWRDTKQDQPHLAVLRLKNAQTNYRWCSGAIISERFIVTTASCITTTGAHLNMSDSFIYAGRTQIPGVPQKYSMKNFTLHPKFKNTEYDIALIEVDTPLQFSDELAPIQLYQHKLIPDKRIRWSSFFPIDETLTWLTWEIKGRTLIHFKCTTLTDGGEQQIIIDNQICVVGYDMSRSLRLIEGSSMTHNNKLIGVASQESENDRKMDYSEPTGKWIVTRISSYLEWIEKVANVTA